MDLTPQTTIHDLVEAHPEALEFLAAYRPEFAKLRNPLLRATLGRMATLETAAVMGGVPVDRLIADLRRAIAGPAGGPGPSPAPAATPADPGRLAELKAIIRELHAGGDPDALKRRFAVLAKDVDSAGIARMEQQLIDEGMPRQEIQKLCDVHVAIFQDALDREPAADVPPGHPVHTYRLENRALEAAAGVLRDLAARLGDPPDAGRFAELRPAMQAAHEQVAAVERHYLRKENQLFPLLEKHGFSGPSQVMWGLHDEIRATVKRSRSAIAGPDAARAAAEAAFLARKVVDMVYKEERVLFPAALGMLAEGDWARIREGEAAIGYALAAPAADWPPKASGPASPAPPSTASRVAAPGDTVYLDTGLLTQEQVNLLLKSLPVDVTFVDETDTVRYYSEGRGRVFVRSPEIIGRKVQQCHPPKSLHVVNRILDSFRKGEKDVAEFWIRFKDRLIHIRYFAVRDAKGAYRGTIEVTQDITGIQALQGERRLLDWGKMDV
jgi:DUF438 domain-containing protein